MNSGKQTKGFRGGGGWRDDRLAQRLLLRRARVAWSTE